MRQLAYHFIGGPEFVFGFKGDGDDVAYFNVELHEPYLGPI